jgi:hypothetical protein
MINQSANAVSFDRGFDDFEPVPGCPDGDPPTTGGLQDLGQEASTVANITAMYGETDYPIKYIQQKEDWLADVSKTLGLPTK